KPSSAWLSRLRDRFGGELKIASSTTTMAHLAESFEIAQHDQLMYIDHFLLAPSTRFYGALIRDSTFR
ncbi:MAG TPA: hypothetical protein VFH87_10705, partial [Candidatus Udaeobacter sp.]|nr:hypothetical protein [Candidatus Udaeobacter sp.]